MSRNLTFFILGLMAAVLAYIFYPSLTGLLEMVVTSRLPREFTRLLQSSDLVAFAGFISIFGLSFFLLYLIFPVLYVWYHIHSAKSILSELPLVSNAGRRTDKKAFLSALKDMGFIARLGKSYGSYLWQGPEEDVKQDAVKNIRMTAARGKKQKLVISPVSARAPAEVIFNVDSLVTDNLFLSFFSIFSRMMIGAGMVCLGIAVISLSFVQGEMGVALLSVVQPGVTAFLYLLFSAVMVAGMTRMAHQILSQSATSLARMINGLFYQNDWQQDLGRITAHLEGDAAAERMENVLKSGFDKPMKEMSRAVKALGVEQEKKLDNILSKTLDSFTDNLMKKSGRDMEYLTKSLKDASLGADQMKKQMTSAGTEFMKQMDKQSSAIAKHLADMQKTLVSSEKTTHAASEKIVSALAKEVEKTQKNFGAYMENSLKKLDEKQAMVDKKVTDKDSILKDLHDAAKDLATISNASGMLLERFITLSTELDSVLKNIKDNTPVPHKATAADRDKLKSAMIKLQKINKDRISALPDM